MAKERKLHADQLPHGNKAEQVAAIRAEQREQEAVVQMSLNFSFGDNDWPEEVARQGLARIVLDDYFRLQVGAGLVSLWIRFTDGPPLPNTGKQKVLYSYNTQHRMPGPRPASCWDRWSPILSHDVLMLISHS